jgi:hypothetical protein
MFRILLLLDVDLMKVETSAPYPDPVDQTDVIIAFRIRFQIRNSE